MEKDSSDSAEQLDKLGMYAVIVKTFSMYHQQYFSDAYFLFIRWSWALTKFDMVASFFCISSQMASFHMYHLSQRSCGERRAPTWVDRVWNRKSVSGFLPFDPFKFGIFWNCINPKVCPPLTFYIIKSHTI